MLTILSEFAQEIAKFIFLSCEIILPAFGKYEIRLKETKDDNE